jgi:ribosomal protein L15
MVKTHKRKKSSRIRGARTCGWGFRQKHKGPGNRGGRGMAGSGKRADHKKQEASQMDTSNRKQYFGKQGLTSRGTKRKKENKINLSDIKNNYFKKINEQIDLKNHVILGNGEGFKGEILAKRASKTAIEKMNKAGGKITFSEHIIKKNKENSQIKDKKQKQKKEEKEELEKKKEKQLQKESKPKKEKKEEVKSEEKKEVKKK